jgi:hypothetical protein
VSVLRSRWGVCRASRRAAGLFPLAEEALLFLGALRGPFPAGREGYAEEGEGQHDPADHEVPDQPLSGKST